MKPQKVFGAALVSGLTIGASLTSNQINISGPLEIQQNDIEGTGRYFPLLPPYQGVDYAFNWNKLKSPGDQQYFVVRDTIVYVGVQLMWVVLHQLFWDGTANTNEDVTKSLLSPGHKVELSQPSSNSRLGVESLRDISVVKLWNFFANPSGSTRNLYLNFGFSLAQQLLWIIPTFIGPIGDLPDVGKSDDGLVATWNRILKPQGIVQIIAINTLLWLGKLVFWGVAAVVQDIPNGSETVPATGRKMNFDDDKSFLSSVKDEFMNEVEMNVRMIILSIENNSL